LKYSSSKCNGVFPLQGKLTPLKGQNNSVVLLHLNLLLLLVNILVFNYPTVAIISVRSFLSIIEPCLKYKKASSTV